MPVSSVTSQPLTFMNRHQTLDMLPIAERQFASIDQSGNIDISDEKARLREAANDFEAIFIRQLLSSMRSTLSEGGLFGEGTAGEIYSGFMDEAIADKVAERGGVGLADVLYNRMVTYLDPTENKNAESSVFTKGSDEI